jgi:hypothetical protein
VVLKDYYYFNIFVLTVSCIDMTWKGNADHKRMEESKGQRAMKSHEGLGRDMKHYEKASDSQGCYNYFI